MLNPFSFPGVVNGLCNFTGDGHGRQVFSYPFSGFLGSSHVIGVDVIQGVVDGFRLGAGGYELLKSGRGDAKSGRHREAGMAHFAQVGAFAAHRRQIRIADSFKGEDEKRGRNGFIHARSSRNFCIWV